MSAPKIHRFADYDKCSELSESQKDWFYKSKYQFLFQFFPLFKPYLQLTETFSVEKVKEMLGAWRHCQIVFWEGSRSNRKLRVISNSSVDLLPSFFLGLVYPSTRGTSGLGFTFPCLHVAFSYHEFFLKTDLSLSDLSKKINPSHLNQICL